MSRRATISAVSLWAMRYAAHRWGALIGVIVAMLAKAGLDVLKPWPMVFLVDHILQGRVMPEWVQRFVQSLPGPATTNYLIGWSVAGTVVLFLLSWAVSLLMTYASLSLGQRMVYDLAADLFARLQKLSLRFHARHAVGDTIRRITADCSSVATIIKDGLVPVVSALVTLVAIFGVMWRVNPTLTLLAVAVVPYMILVFRAYAQPMLDESYRQQEFEGQIYTAVEQTFSALPVVQAFAREDWNDQYFKRCTADTVTATLSLTNIQLRFKVLIGLSTAFGTAGILWIGARQAMAGDITVGAILLFLSYLGALYAPIESVMYTSSTLQGAAGSVQRVWEITDLEPDVRDKPGAPALGRVRGHITLENVSFGYEPNQPVVREVSLDIAPDVILSC